MTQATVQTFSLAQKQFCWSGIGARDGGSANAAMQPHRHSFFQVFFLAAGRAVHDIGGRLFTADAGSIFFIRPYTVHCVSFPPDSECYFLYFSAGCLQDGFVSAEAAAHDATLLSRPELAPFVYQAHCEYKLDRDEVDIARRRCLRIQECCGTRGVYDAIEARAELVLLLTAVARKYQPQFSVLQSSVCSEGVIDSRARAALEFIQRNFRSSLSLSEVASHVHLTGTYLTHLLKQELGKSFKQLVDDVRLENSKNLLAYTDARMQKIALESGFLDQAHFAKRFKALTQLTPGQFRREHQGSLAGGQFDPTLAELHAPRERA